MALGIVKSKIYNNQESKEKMLSSRVRVLLLHIPRLLHGRGLFFLNDEKNNFS